MKTSWTFLGIALGFTAIGAIALVSYSLYRRPVPRIAESGVAASDKSAPLPGITVAADHHHGWNVREEISSAFANPTIMTGEDGEVIE